MAMTGSHSDMGEEKIPGTRARLSSAVLVIGGVCVLVELGLQASDFHLIGSPLWRSLAYQSGAFWPGLLHGWKPNYPLQPVAMFLTYAFLHGGFGHLAGNMITLLALGEVVMARVGQKGFLLIYAVSALVGAALFGVLATGPLPMVGASGALFGLMGAWLYWDFIDPERRRRRFWRLVRGAGILVVLNVVLWVLFDGRLAWQAHLGGALAGWATAAALNRWSAGRTGGLPGHRE